MASVFKHHTLDHTRIRNLVAVTEFDLASSLRRQCQTASASFLPLLLSSPLFSSRLDFLPFCCRRIPHLSVHILSRPHLLIIPIVVLSIIIDLHRYSLSD